MFVLTTYGKEKNLFLVDRNKVKNCWWTEILSDAKIFYNKESAEPVKNKLSFGSPEIVSLTVAKELEKENLEGNLNE